MRVSKHVAIVVAALTVAVAAPWLLLQPAASERAAQSPAATPAAAPAVIGNVAHAQADAPATQLEGVTAQPAAASASAKPKPAIRIAFESEPRDATAPEFESKIRALYAEEPDAAGVLRDVSCTQSVCKIDVRWSAQLNRGYNAALLKVIGALSKEVALEPAGPPDGNATPIAIYVRRPPTPHAQK